MNNSEDSLFLFADNLILNHMTQNSGKWLALMIYLLVIQTANVDFSNRI